MKNSSVRRVALGAIALVLAFAAAACGDDTSDASSTTTTTKATTTASKTFCDTTLEVEKVAGSEDSSGLEALYPKLEAAAPKDQQATVSAVVSAAKAMDPDGPPDAAFAAAHDKFIGAVKDTCGFPEMSANAKEYEFDGLPTEVKAGPTVVSIHNVGTEAHMIDVARINDGVTDSIHDLLMMDQSESEKKVTDLGTAFALPGEVGHTVLDLKPGRYAALCFIPVGSTPAAMQASGGQEPQGPPHAMQGMFKEFTVK